MADNRIEDLRRRVQKDPASIAFAQLAEELRRAGELRESVDTCRAGLALHPSYLSARVTLGRALVELNQLDAAQEELTIVLRSAPENLAAMRALGEIFQQRGEEVQALAQFRAALTIARNDPDLAERVEDLARKLEPKRPAGAEGLTQSEFLQHLPSPPAVPAITEAASSDQLLASPAAVHVDPPPATVTAVDVDPVPVVQEALPADGTEERERANRAVAALEGWLDAVHAAHPDRRS
jgi:tetratricopeptide (TPR) repeat protein